MFNEAQDLEAYWDLKYYENYGTPEEELVHHEYEKNVITNGGRSLTLYNLFALAGSSTALYMCAGSGSTAASNTDTHLTAELIAGTNRKLLVNNAGTQLVAGNVTLSTFDDTSVGSPGQFYYVNIQVQATYLGASDANVNQYFQEFGLVTALACPATPTGTSGVLFNHYVAASPIQLTTAITLVVTVTLRV